MGNYLEEFKEELYRTDKSENTIKSYASHILDYIKFIESRIEEYNPEEILELDIREYRGFLLNVEKQKPSTINCKLVALYQYCKFLHNNKILKDNPAQNISLIKIQATNIAPSTLPQNELYRLRREFYRRGNKRDIVIYELFYNTGVRASELCNVQISDITISDRKGLLVVREGKGNKYRELPLNKDVRKAIEEYLKVRGKHNNDYLIQGQRGPLGRTGVFRIIQKYGEWAAVSLSMGPHKLRHQFCKDLSDIEKNIRIVAELAGHTNINTTMKYTQPTAQDVQETVEKLGSHKKYD